MFSAHGSPSHKCRLLASSVDNMIQIQYLCRLEGEKLDDEVSLSKSLDEVSLRGRKRNLDINRLSWSSEDIDELIDIVLSNTRYKRKLIFINTKNQRNREICGDILADLKERASTER